jgi:cytochrome c peroxidase
MFWDGRKDSMWSQALGPPEGPVEMNSSRLTVVHFIAAHYRAPYEKVFGPLPDLSDATRFPASGRPGQPSFDGMAPADQMIVNRIYSNFGKAIAAYERRLVDRDSAFDRFMHGDESAISAAAIRGAKLFVGRAACNECHSGPALSDGKFHNHGVPQVGPTVPAIDRGRADGIPQVVSDAFNGAGVFSDAPSGARLVGLSVQPSDLGAFKTPTLRNLTRTAPYMHTGQLATLWDVVAWYRSAAGSDGFVGMRDPAVQPLRLSDGDLLDLVEFLTTLDGAPLPAALVTAPALP